MREIKKSTSKCMYCGSTSYGAGCPYSPHKKHVHTADSSKCVYCGSVSVGTGCPYNPFSKYHLKGVEYNSMVAESLHKTLMTTLFLSRLTQPVCEMVAYKLGLIDNEGHQIKECITDEEKAALTPLDMHILKIRRLIEAPVIELFKSQILLEISSKSTPKKFDVSKFQQEVKLTSQIDHAINCLSETFTTGIEQGFSKEYIENIIIASILKQHEH